MSDETSPAKFVWIQKQNMGPRARGGHAIAFEARFSRVIAFGGEAAGQFLNDTWAWDGRLWVQISDMGPPPRTSASMTAIAPDHFLLFGGRATEPFGDTWQWSDAGWVQIEDAGPSRRAGHALAFDLAHGHPVLFGGSDGSTIFDDTWVWVDDEWVQRENAGPAGRSGHVMVCDRRTGQIILFGGTASDESLLGDTWEWDGSRWLQLADMGPSARTGAAMVSTAAGLVLFGGTEADAESGDKRPLGDTWLWQRGRWQQVQDMGPGPRFAHAMAFNPGGRLTLFGGIGGLGAETESLGDTWERSGDGFPPGPATLGVMQVIPADARLVNPGDQIRVVYAVSNVAPQGDTLISELDTPFGISGSSPALSWAPETVSIGPEDTGGEIVITLGTEPVEPGHYRLLMVLASTPGGWQSGIEAKAPFEVGDPATVDQIRLMSLSFGAPHALDHPGDSLSVWCGLSRSVRPDEVVVLSVRAVDFAEGVSVPASVTVPSGQQNISFGLTRTADAMEPGTYTIAVSVEGSPDSEKTLQFAVEL